MTGDKQIFFLSAADRINYGDLLFPIIFKTFAEKKGYKFSNFGLIGSNLSDFGALPTNSYRILLNKLRNAEGKLVIGGGEVFFADWRTLYGFINPYYSKALQFKWFRKVDEKLNLSRYLLCSNRVLVPFCPSKSELKNKNLEVYYNSVGGSYPYGKNKREINTIIEALNEAEIVSVRNKKTSNELNKLGINAKIVPDSAILISEIFSTQEILEKLSFNNSTIKKKYVFLQLGNNKGPADLNLFAKKITDLSNNLNLQIILCPIGKAPGHQDDIILKKLEQLNSKFQYIEPNNIFDIMYLISNASFYMGTSLHGVITAQSFNIPFIGLNENLIKVDAYTKTWIGPNHPSLSFDDIEKAIKIFKNWDFIELSNKTSKQKKLVRQNINSFFDV